MLNHGGRLNKAAVEHNIPLENWIDLSTGINPEHWPIPSIPPNCFTRLPEEGDGLVEAAQQYYQVDNILPVAGSQAAIQLLPYLRVQSKVAVPEVGYAEHAYQWKAAGHDVVFYNAHNMQNVVKNTDVLVVINPNNPTGENYSREQLIKWHQNLQSRQGWLIVDEAFIDCEDIVSSVGLSHQSGLIVLRSTGKFFGLAGVRSGFVFAEKSLLEKMNEALGQWALTGVSRFVTKKALIDIGWQQQTKKNLQLASEKMHGMIVESTGVKPSGSHLFKTIMHPQAEVIYQQFAYHGVLIRLLDNKQGIRFGLPKESQWGKVSEVFEKVFAGLNQQEEAKKRITA